MKTVLYVEDDIDVVNIMKDMLEMFFSEVHIAYNGNEGLELYKKHNPSLIISDIVMPQMNGLEMSKEILKINSNEKIILITADNESDYHTKAKEIGVYGYLNKPIDFNELKAMFKALDS